jgi:hypothetical protein
VTRAPKDKPATAAQVESLEQALHKALERWAADHARRYDQIGMLDYDPVRFVAQQIGTSVTPGAVVRPSLETLRQTYVRTAGAVAEQTLAAFETRSIGERIRDSVERGRSVAVLCAHADGLDDAAGFAGAVAVAMHGSQAAMRNGVILNKVMSRETFAGVPITNLLGAFANIYWVIPDSESARRWGISERALRYVNSLGIRSLLAAVRDGAAITFAPAGSAMIPSFDGDGNLVGLRFPPVGRATMKLLTRFDSYVLAARFGGQVHVGEPRPVEAPQSPPLFANAPLVELGEIVAALAGVPVETTSKETKAA